MLFKKVIISALWSVILTSPLYSQRLLNKITKQACNCINQKDSSFNGSKIALFQGCIMGAINLYQNDIEKKYGKDFFTPGSTVSITVNNEIGRILADKCPKFLAYFSNEIRRNNTSIRTLKAQAKGEMETGDFPEAIKSYTAVIEKMPNDFDAYNSRGYCYYLLDDYYRAISDYLRAIDLNPAFAQAYSNMALAKIKLYDWTSSLDDANAAIESDSTLAIAYNNRGIIYYNTDQPEAALKDFIKALDLDSINGGFAYDCGATLYDLQRYPEAIDYLKRALGLNHMNAATYNHLGMAYFKTQQYNEAKNYFSLAIDTDTAEVSYQINMGDTFEKLCEYEAAYDSYTSAIRLLPNDCELYQKRGNILLSLNRKSEACPDFKKALELGCQEAKRMIKKNCK